VSPSGPPDVEDVEEEEEEEREEEEEADWPAVDSLPVDIDDLMVHLQALQDIADANDSNRGATTPGFDASVDYVTDQLEEVGYAVSLHEFTITGEVVNQPPEMELLSDGTVFVEGVDFTTMTYSGSAEVVGPVIPVDLQLPPGPVANDSSSGCEPGDFFGFPEGGIALIQRGSCSFRDKAELAVAAGASAVLVFNEGQAGRTGLFAATLGEGDLVDTPVMVLTFAAGETLAEAADAGDTNLRVLADTELVDMPTVNVIAETAGVTEDVVVVGAHLDSVTQGPGINDNGSGAMLVLEMARAVAREEISTNNTIRWVLWGGEELGLLGSFDYVRGLNSSEKSNILANLNFDMVASPNPVRFVYDGDGSDSSESGPVGSGQIEAMFNDWFEALDMQTQPTPFDGRSDYGPFIWAGIPAGGLFTGAEQRKTEAQEEAYGGTSGLAYDACYHQGCDTIENVDPGVYAEMAAAAGHSVLSLANLEGGFGVDGPPAAFDSSDQPISMPLGMGGCHSHSHTPEYQ